MRSAPHIRIVMGLRHKNNSAAARQWCRRCVAGVHHEAKTGELADLPAISVIRQNLHNRAITH